MYHLVILGLSLLIVSKLDAIGEDCYQRYMKLKKEGKIAEEDKYLVP